MSVSALGTALFPIPSVSLSLSLEGVLLQSDWLDLDIIWVVSEVGRRMGVFDRGGNRWRERDNFGASYSNRWDSLHDGGAPSSQITSLGRTCYYLSTNLSMISKLVKFNDCWTTELGIAAGEFKSCKKVAENARNWLELCPCKSTTVNRAGWLTIQPIVNTRRTECMLTLSRLATSVNKTTFTRSQQQWQQTYYMCLLQNSPVSWFMKAISCLRLSQTV